MNSSTKREERQMLIPAPQAARTLGISRQTLRRLIHRKALKAVKIGNLQRVYIPQSEIDRIVSGDLESLAENVSVSKPATALNNFSGDSNLFQPVPESAKSPNQRMADLLAAIYADD